LCPAAAHEEDYPLNTAKDANLPAPAKASGKSSKPVESDPELDGLMAEIESDLREDELKKIWKKHGSLIVALIVALVVGVTGFQLYRQYAVAQRAEMARSYEAAVKQLKDGKTDEALSAFAVLGAKGGEGYGALARLSQAALQVEKKDIDGAIATYKSIADDNGVDPVLRDLATLLHVLQSMDRTEAKALEAELAPLNTPNNPFKYSVMEITALLAAQQGDAARAATLAGELAADPGVPPSMRQRANDLQALYKANAPAAPAPAPAAAAPTPAAPVAAPPAAPPPAAKP